MRFQFPLLLLVLTVLGTSGCNSIDEDATVVGTWTLDTYNYNLVRTFDTEEDTSVREVWLQENGVTPEWEFTENPNTYRLLTPITIERTFTDFDDTATTTTTTGVNNITGTWTRTEDRLTLSNIQNRELTFDIQRLNEEELRLRWDEVSSRDFNGFAVDEEESISFELQR